MAQNIIDAAYRKAIKAHNKKQGLPDLTEEQVIAVADAVKFQTHTIPRGERIIEKLFAGQHTLYSLDNPELLAERIAHAAAVHEEKEPTHGRRARVHGSSRIKHITRDDFAERQSKGR